MFVGLRNVLLLSVCLIFAAGQAGAVALGKIEVTSHLGEVFFAEAPLQLEDGEKVADVTVETAAPSDYQILEVFRDPALNKLSVNIVNDLRGPRAVISSSEAIDTPYFNLVLKLRHGHATNFKKYPVFLDLPEQVRPAAPAPAPVARPQPVQEVPAAPAAAVRPVEPSTPVYQPEAPVSAADESAIEPTGSEFNPYEGWARTSRYGPMVRGDSISTVARRLRVDERYTLNQVMVGLFNKNKDKFRENNINLINAGTYLNVPTAEEVESVPASQAESIIKQQEKRWKDLRNQPVYAAEAEAQQNRYRTRVHVGQQASGTAAAPVRQQPKAQSGTAMDDRVTQQADGGMQAADDQLRALQQENLRLKQALQESESRADSAPTTSADAAAAQEQVRKLELTVARLQRQLKLVNQELQEVKSQDMNALTYAMAAVILLLIGVAGYLLFLLRRDRPHPAMPANNQGNAGDVAPAAAAVTAAGAVADDMDAGAGEMDNEDFAASLDSDTAEPEREALQDDGLLFESKAPTAQTGVDYLTEAEVYLRYGMDDEALQQMHLAIEQKPDNAEAHRKLVGFLQARGDQAAMTAAIEAARSALSGSDLEAFENEFGDDTGTEAVAVPDDVADQAADDINIDDLLATMDGTAGEPEAGREDAEKGVTGASGDGGLDLGDMDFTGTESSESSGLDSDSGAEESPYAEETGHQAEESVDTNDAVSANDAVSEDAVETDGDADFVSTIDISAPEETASEENREEGHGLEFDSSDVEPEVESNKALTAAADHADDDGLEFDAGKADEVKADGDDATGISAGDDDGLDLDAILGEFESTDDQDSTPQVDFASAGDDVTSFEHDAGDVDDGPETVIEADASDGDLGLDDILGEFENYETDVEGNSDTADDNTADGERTDAIAAMPEMDVSEELDDLLAEWGEESAPVSFDAGPESLDLDRARSLLAEGSLDEAEAALQSALEGERRGDALIGLAELAARRGDAARSGELLAEAEALVNDSNREWFDSVKNLSA